MKYVDDVEHRKPVKAKGGESKLVILSCVGVFKEGINEPYSLKSQELTSGTPNRIHINYLA